MLIAASTDFEDFSRGARKYLTKLFSEVNDRRRNYCAIQVIELPEHTSWTISVQEWPGLALIWPDLKSMIIDQCTLG